MRANRHTASATTQVTTNSPTMKKPTSLRSSPPSHASGRAPGDHQQTDLGRGVEAEPEQHADRVDVPALRHRLGEAAEPAVHEAAVVEMVLERSLVVVAPAHGAEDLDDPDQDHQVGDAD